MQAFKFNVFNGNSNERSKPSCTYCSFSRPPPQSFSSSSVGAFISRLAGGMSDFSRAGRLGFLRHADGQKVPPRGAAGAKNQSAQRLKTCSSPSWTCACSSIAGRPAGRLRACERGRDRERSRRPWRTWVPWIRASCPRWTRRCFLSSLALTGRAPDRKLARLTSSITTNYSDLRFPESHALFLKMSHN